MNTSIPKVVKVRADERSLTEAVKSVILSHASQGKENTTLYCTADCLAQAIVAKVHYHTENNL